MNENEQVKVSVLMSVYNESNQMLSEAINSILNQTFTKFEYIIVNDNPRNKRIGDILAKFEEKDSRIRVITNSRNEGLQSSLNKGLKYCNAKYVLRMDADDVSFNTRIAKQYEVITKGNYDVVGTSYNQIDENGNKIGEVSYSFKSKIDLDNTLLLRNVIAHPTVIMSKEKIFEFNGYRKIEYAEDYDLWLRLLSEGANFYVMPESLLEYRMRSNSITKSNKMNVFLATMYVKKLFIERRKKGKDSYSTNDYQNYLSTLYLEKEKKEFIKIINNNNKLSFFKSKIYRNHIYLKIRMLLYRK